MKTALKAGVLAMAVAACSPAFAALGSYPMSGADRNVTATRMVAAQAVQASASVAQATSSSASASSSAYTVNEVTLASGTVVREFVATATNQVFAVSWKGPHLPNFKDILGTYASRYLTPNSTDNVKKGGLGQNGISASDIVVQSLGRFGQFSGYAYLPSAVPAGVSLSQLQ